MSSHFPFAGRAPQMLPRSNAATNPQRTSQGFPYVSQSGITRLENFISKAVGVLSRGATTDQKSNETRLELIEKKVDSQTQWTKWMLEATKALHRTIVKHINKIPLDEDEGDAPLDVQLPPLPDVIEVVNPDLLPVQIPIDDEGKGVQLKHFVDHLKDQRMKNMVIIVVKQAVMALGTPPGNYFGQTLKAAEDVMTVMFSRRFMKYWTIRGTNKSTLKKYAGNPKFEARKGLEKIDKHKRIFDVVIGAFCKVSGFCVPNE